MSSEVFPSKPIQIYDSVTAEQFRQTIQTTRRPAVLRGLNVGPCLEKWPSVEYLLKQTEDKPVKVNN
jgi:hypothetical protein